jgi:hypothetical protein
MLMGFLKKKDSYFQDSTIAFYSYGMAIPLFYQAVQFD